MYQGLYYCIVLFKATRAQGLPNSKGEYQNRQKTTETVAHSWPASKDFMCSGKDLLTWYSIG